MAKVPKIKVPGKIINKLETEFLGAGDNISEVIAHYKPGNKASEVYSAYMENLDKMTKPGAETVESVIKDAPKAEIPKVEPVVEPPKAEHTADEVESIKAEIPKAQAKAEARTAGATTTPKETEDLFSKQRSVDSVMAQRQLKKQGSIYDYTQTRAAKQTSPIYSHMDETNTMIKEGKLTKERAAGIGIDEEAFKAGNAESYQEAANKFYGDKLGSINRETTFGDKWGYHRGTEKTIAVGSTAFLVSRMSESKGQMSNAGLYGQGQGY
jgi:hypothetical protein